MREIKFRVWCKDRNEWEKDPLRLSLRGDILHLGRYGEMLVNPETHILLQYTGLKDKNGVEEIFEYDIINKKGLRKGNYYENEYLLKEKTNLLVEKMGTGKWKDTEQEAIKRGCKYAE